MKEDSDLWIICLAIILIAWGMGACDPPKPKEVDWNKVDQLMGWR